MRTTNILKIVIIIILLWIAIVLTSNSYAQGSPNGFPTGGNGNGGPPPPPPTYCDANPGDPACNGNLSTPIDQGDRLVLLIGLIGGTYLLHKHNKKQYDR